MGIFDKLFGSKPNVNNSVREYFRTLTAYQPTFTDWSGGLYEMDATRAAIHAVATHCSKLKPHVMGQNNKRLERMLQTRPNPWMTTSQFLYRVATILEVENTCFIVPMLDKQNRIIGLFPILPTQAEVVQTSDGTAFLRFRFRSGQIGAMEWSKVGVMTKMQFSSDLFGETNRAVRPTLSLLDMQNQAINSAIKQSAAVRFMARLGSSLRPEDLKKEQDNFKALNLSADNAGGVMIIDQKYADVKQIDSKPYVVDADTMKIIDNNVNSYFGVNEKILRNEYNEEEWNAFYEGKIEPFALQISMVLTGMFFNEREVAFGNEVMFSANRLQFATVPTKVNTIVQLFDRGMLSANEGREIMQMPSIGEIGDVFMIRGEYVASENKANPKLIEEGETDEGNQTDTDK